jgi:hypothetical protein
VPEGFIFPGIEHLVGIFWNVSMDLNKPQMSGTWNLMNASSSSASNVANTIHESILDNWNSYNVHMGGRGSCL